MKVGPCPTCGKYSEYDPVALGYSCQGPCEATSPRTAGDMFYERTARNLHLMHELATALGRRTDNGHNREMVRLARMAREIHLDIDQAHREYCEEVHP